MLKELKSKKVIIALIFIIMISVLGVTYAFFEYYGVSADYVVSAGEVTLTFNEGTDTIDLTNIFPETKEEARERDDNVITFTVSGVNTTENKDIWYEIMLNEGEEVEGLTRFLPKELMFDLTEINPDGTENLVVDNMNFGKFDNTRIWVNTILKDNETTFTRTYELRMWLSDKVLISDTYEGADYTTSEFRQRYASVKVSVFGDFNEKSAPYNYMAKINTSSYTFWPTSIYNVKTNITQVNFVSLPQSEIDTRYDTASIKEDVTDTTKGGSVKAWLEADETDATKYVMYVASDGITFFPSNSSYMFSSFSNLKKINYDNINTNTVTDMSSMFSGCSGLTTLDLTPLETSAVKNMSQMFQSCSSLTSLDLSKFDTSAVANMSNMFYYCSGLTSLDVSGFDTSAVTSMYSIFYYCSSLTRLDLGNFDTGNVTNMIWMFAGCSSLTSLDVSNFDTIKVTSMSGMFLNCSSLESLNLSNFDTSNVEYMGGSGYSNGMFYNCKSLKNLNLDSFDTSKVKSMGFMFSGCSNLTSLDVSSFNTSMVTNMSWMFNQCEGLTSLNVGNFDTSSVTNMYRMFAYCISLNSLDVSGFDTNKVTDMFYMFRDCSNLTTIYANSDWNTGKVTSSYEMFYNCKKLVGATSYSSSKVDITMANPTTGYFTVKPTEETPAA